MGEQKYQLSRRRFTVGLAACSASAILPVGIPRISIAQTVATTGVAQIFLDLHRIHKWDNSNGDTWDPSGRMMETCMPSIAMAGVSVSAA